MKQGVLFPELELAPPFTESDWRRLKTLQDRILGLMWDGEWRTLREITRLCGGSETGASAQLRGLRRARNGGYTVHCRRAQGDAGQLGLFCYRVVPGSGQ